MTKEEKIKEVWNGRYNLYKPNKEGWSTIILTKGYLPDNKIFDIELISHGRYRVRPKSLQGIENNNGWIKIESEVDLPKIQGYDFSTKYWTIVNGEIRDDIRYNLVYKQWQKIEGCLIKEINVTHYQPIEKLKPPIY